MAPAFDPPVERFAPHGSAPLTRFPARLEGPAKAGPSSSFQPVIASNVARFRGPGRIW